MTLITYSSTVRLRFTSDTSGTQPGFLIAYSSKNSTIQSVCNSINAMVSVADAASVPMSKKNNNKQTKLQKNNKSDTMTKLDKLRYG